MKKLVLAVLFLLGTIFSFSQTLLGFDQPICGSAVSHTYTYLNYTTGGGSSALHGYKIYKDGVEVHFNSGGSMSGSLSVADILFINNSTGYIAVQCGGMATRLHKTSDFGSTWTHMPADNPPGYKDVYIVNEHFAYLISIFSGHVFVAKCSDVVTPPLYFIDDDSVTTDIYKTDTIFGNSLCGTDSLTMFIQNLAGDTISYHINFFILPLSSLGINEQSNNKETSLVYPNPAGSEITIDADFAVAEIYSVQGQKVLSGTARTLSVASLSPGTYFIRIIAPDGMILHSKFIKE